MTTIPPVPRPARPPLTTKEAHYLQALRAWSWYMGRPPALHELAAYCQRTKSPVYGALVSLEHKGYVRRNEARQFVVVGSW